MTDELRGWKEIASHLGTSERTAQRWEHVYQLPVRRAGQTRGASGFALRGDLDRWRLSPEGVRASSENGDAAPTTDAREESAAPSRTRFRVALVAAIIGVAVLCVLVFAWAILSQTPASVRSFAPPAPAREGFAVPASSAVFVLQVTTPQDTPFVFRVIDGGMATLEVRGVRKIGLVPAKSGARATLAVYDMKAQRGGESLKELKTSSLPLRTPVHVELPGTTMDIEWLEMAQFSVVPARGVDAPPLRCCIICGPIVACAVQVTASCGSCCGFEGCRKPK
jgi:hypothetical protein